MSGHTRRVRNGKALISLDAQAAEGRYLVADPINRTEKWMEAEVINAEASGYFIVHRSNLPAGWRLVGRPEAETVRMATLSPATVLGLERTKGKIAPGYDADLAILDKGHSVVGTMIRGEFVYQAGRTW